MNKRLFLLLALLFLFTACGGSTTEEDAEYTYPPSSCYTYNLIGEDESAYENEVGETEQICTTELDEPEEPAPDTVSFSIEELTQRELDNLPVWLSVGLDLYLNSADARDISNAVETARQMVADGLPGFGDAWFIPGFIPDTSPRDIEMVAHAFVQHISEAGALREFVGKHTQAQYADDAITAAVNFWSDFTGAKNDSGFIIRYERGRVQTVEGAPLSPFGIVLSVRSTYAVYYFGHERDGTPEQWTWDMVSHHVAIGEESIFFVSDWFGHEPNRRFVVFNIHIDVPYGSGGGGYINRRITNFQNILDPPWAMAHEAVHAVLSTSAANIRNNFPVV
ncbi:MAG: hypothetical protein FWC92_08125, partial [Defluviitaleaceae bacterium]|nr:hypothetical protein [Defluviitaleaceae bacterium]